MTQQFKGTPGEWTARWKPSFTKGENSDGFGLAKVENSDSYGVAWCGQHSFMTEAEVKANARLIAAAPELLSALQNAVGLWGFDATDDAQRAWLTESRAAIAKALGDE